MHIDVVIHDATLILYAAIWCSPCPSIPSDSKNMVDMHDVVTYAIEMAHDIARLLLLSYLIFIDFFIG